MSTKRIPGHHSLTRISLDLPKITRSRYLVIELVQPGIHFSGCGLKLDGVLGEAQFTSATRHRHTRHEKPQRSVLLIRLP